MATESVPPPPAAGSNLKYVLIGVALIIAAAAVWFGMDACDADPGPGVQAQPDAGTPVDRGGALVDDDLFIPDPEPDAGPPVPDAGPRIRYVTRYVGGGGNWDCSGNIPPEAAQRALAQNNLQFRNCYERRLKVNNQLEGRVTVRMRVDRTGDVSAVQVGGSLHDSQVLSCVRGIANRIHFPAPTGGSCAVVAAPFNFTPRQ